MERREKAAAAREERHEEDVSAQQPQAQAHARLSGPHANEGRPARPEAPPPEGPQAPRGLSQARRAAVRHERALPPVATPAHAARSSTGSSGAARASTAGCSRCSRSANGGAFDRLGLAVSKQGRGRGRPQPRPPAAARELPTHDARGSAGARPRRPREARHRREHARAEIERELHSRLRRLPRAALAGRPGRCSSSLTPTASLLAPLVGGHCRYLPSCSVYAAGSGARCTAPGAAPSSRPAACCAATRSTRGGPDPVPRAGRREWPALADPRPAGRRPEPRRARPSGDRRGDVSPPALSRQRS